MGNSAAVTAGFIDGQVCRFDDEVRANYGVVLAVVPSIPATP
jgi:hypothetical protein